MDRICSIFWLTLFLVNTTSTFHRPSPFYSQPYSKVELSKPYFWDAIIKNLIGEPNKELRATLCSETRPDSTYWSANRCWENDDRLTGFRDFMALRNIQRM